ncbi:protein DETOXIFICATION 21-like isoform X2 [Salvia splendens]|uniref:protein DETOXIFICATION 21-like isoform X2 n=1 Tax=Salvia splendens TaxID=180675 RepID=UPI001C26229F|nr:protein DETOXIFICATION 21-like isoform X2 [Salvia splendens]
MGGDIYANLLEADVGQTEPSSSVTNKIWSETKKMWIVAGPAILVPFSTFGIIVISQAFIGQIDSTELAAYSLVYTVIFRFVLGLQFGMVTGVGTLCGQAFGAKLYHKLGVYLQQSCIISLVVTALMTPLFVFAAPILKTIGQDHNIADMAGKYAPWFVAVGFLYAVMYSCNAFLQSQSKNFVVSFYAVLSLVVHVFLSWLLSMKLRYGVIGVMVSTVMAFLIPNVGQIVYIMRGGCQETWSGFTASAFKDLGRTTRLAISSGVMICLKFCYSTILILLAGNMGNAEVTINALSIWYGFCSPLVFVSFIFALSNDMFSSLNISGWAMMVSVGFMASTGY